MNSTDTDALVAKVRAWTADERRESHLALLRQAPLFDLELASICNVDCAFCPREQITRRDPFMSEATCDALLAFLPDDAVVMVSGLGDASLHPRLASCMGRLVRRGISSCLLTNGIRLSPKLQAELFQAGIAQIQVSVHGLDDDAVSGVVTRGASAGRVRAHLEHLADHRPSDLRVRLNFVETEHNIEAADDVRAFAERLGFDFFWRRQHTRGGRVGDGRGVGAGEGCGIFASVTSITADGDVLPCVNDVRGEDRLGNVRDLDWAEVVDWKREVIERGTWFETCAGCDDDYRWVLLGQGQLDAVGAGVERRM